MLNAQIKTRGSESWDQEEVACMLIFRPMHHCGELLIYTYGSSKL